MSSWKKAMATRSSTLSWQIPWTEEPGRLQFMGSLRVGHDWAASLSISTLHPPALEMEMATHFSVLAWRLPGTGETGGLLSTGSHRVGHDWSDLVAAAAVVFAILWQESAMSVHVPRPECPSYLPPHLIPQGHSSAPALSTSLVMYSQSETYTLCLWMIFML